VNSPKNVDKENIFIIGEFIASTGREGHDEAAVNISGKALISVRHL
jgi:hypothetical protein